MYVLKRTNMQEVIKCHDCSSGVMEGARYAEYEVNGVMYYKCAECYKKDTVLRNFRETEVYSRVVGYIRPVKQWNKGKQAEYKDRKEYVTEGCAC